MLGVSHSCDKLLGKEKKKKTKSAPPTDITKGLNGESWGQTHRQHSHQVTQCLPGASEKHTPEAREAEESRMMKKDTIFQVAAKTFSKAVKIVEICNTNPSSSRPEKLQGGKESWPIGRNQKYVPT